MTNNDARQVAMLLIASLALGAIVALVPTLGVQLALVMGLVLVAISLELARRGRVLNPTWVIVVSIYVVDVLGALLLHSAVGLSTVIVPVAVLGPFVLVALLRRLDDARRLVLLLPLVLLAILAAVSLMWSSDAGYGMEKLSIWLLTALIPAGSIVILAAHQQRPAWRVVGLVAVLAAVGLLLYGTDSPEYPGRISLFGVNPIWAARAVFVGALVVLFGPFPKVLKVAAVPIMVVAGLSTESLGPALGFLVGAFCGAAEALRCADQPNRRVTAGWVALGVTVVLSVFLYASGMLEPLLAPLTRDPNITGRAGLLDAAAPLFLNSPIFGIGLGGFASTGLDTYPHNLVAELALELGIGGFLLAAWWVLMALRGAARSPILMSLVVATATFSLFSGSLASNIEFWLCSALAVAMLPEKHLRLQESRPEVPPELGPDAIPTWGTPSHA